MSRIKLVTLHHTFDLRVLMQMRESHTYFCGAKESSEYVTVKLATQNELLEALYSIGVFPVAITSDERTKEIIAASILKIATKFKTELCTIKGGNLAYDEDDNKIYTFEIVKK